MNLNKKPTVPRAIPFVISTKIANAKQSFFKDISPL